MNLKNIKSWKRILGCFMLAALAMVVMAYWTYKIMYTEFENQRFNSNVEESLKVLNAINKNQINDLKISNSLFVFASINNVKLHQIKPREYFCNQLNEIKANNIISIVSSKVSLSEVQVKQFSNKYEKLKQLCTEVD